MTEDAYTPPERACERAKARIVAAEIHRRGGCGMCLNRDRNTAGWGMGICIIASRSFPLCLKDKLHPSFEIDHAEIGVKC